MSEVFVEKHSVGFWRKLIAAFLCLFFGGVTYAQLILKLPIGSRPPSDVVLIFIALIGGILVPLLLVVLKGKTTVTETNIQIELYPLFRKIIPLEAVLDVKPIIIQPLEEYGGKGIRLRNDSLAFIMDGHSGIRIQVKDCSDIVISSTRTESLLEAINKHRQRLTQL